MERLLRQVRKTASANSEFQSRSYEQLTRGLHPARQSRKVEVFGRPKNPAEAGTLNAVFETMTSLPRLTSLQSEGQYLLCFGHHGVDFCGIGVA